MDNRDTYIRDSNIYGSRMHKILNYKPSARMRQRVTVLSVLWHLAQSGVETAVAATSARYGHEI